MQRNRVKRVLREFFRLHRALMPDDVDVIAVPKRHLKPERVSLALVTQEILPLLAELRAHHGAEDRTGVSRSKPATPDGARLDVSGGEPSESLPSEAQAAAPHTASSGSAPVGEARSDTARKAETGAQ